MSLEKRGSRRVSVDVQATYQLSGRLQIARILNLSCSGCLMVGPELIDPGEKIILSFRIPGSSNDVVVEARTAWGGVMEGTDHRSFGTGLHFEDLSPINTEEIEQYIRPR